MFDIHWGECVMSIKKSGKITCPKCSAKFEVSIWDSVNVAVDKGAKEDILSQKLFNHCCPECGEITHLLTDCMYHDMDKKILIYLLPNYDENEEKLMSRLEELSNNFTSKFGADYVLRVVKTANDLREKIKIFDENLQDTIVEMSKVFYVSDIEEKKPEFILSNIYFDKDENYDENIFVCLDMEGNALSCEFNMGLYESLKKRYGIEVSMKRSNSFEVIDKNWINKFLN